LPLMLSVRPNSHNYKFFVSEDGESDTTTNPTNIFLNLLVAVSVWLLLADISVAVIARSLLGFLAICSMGLALILAVFPLQRTSTMSMLWLIGPGLPFGLLLAFFVRGSTTKTTFGATMGVALVGAMLFFVYLFRRQRLGHSSGSASLNAVRPNLDESYLMIFLVSLPLLRSWPWMIPAALAALLATAILRINRSRCRLQILVPVAVTALWAIAALYSKSLQSRTWWMLADDNQLFEAFAHGLIEYGPTSSPVSAASEGFSAAAYHHLVYFLAGVLEWSSSSAVYVALTRTTVVVVSASLIATVLLVALSLLRLASVNQSLDTTSILVVSIFLLSPPLGPNPHSNFLGCLALIVAVAVTLDFGSISRRWAAAAICIAIVLLTAFSKASYLYAAPLILLSTMFRRTTCWLTTLISVSAASISVLLFFSFFSPHSSDVSVDLFNGFSLGELAFGGIPNRILALVVVFSPLSLAFWGGLLLMRRDSPLNPRALAAVLMLVMTMGYASRFVLGGRIETIRYYWEPALLASSLLLLMILLSFGRQLSRVAVSRGFLLGVVSGLIWVLLIPEIVPDMNSGSVLAKFLRFVRSPAFIMMLASLVALLLVLREIRRERRQTRTASFRQVTQLPRLSQVILIASIGALLAGATPQISEQLLEVRNGLQDDERIPWLGGQDLLDLAEQIKARTQPDDLLAVALCDGVSFNCDNVYSIAAHSDRRFLSLGGTHVGAYRMDETMKEDLRLSLDLGTSEPEDAAGALRARGVGYVVLNSARVSFAWQSALGGPDFLELYRNSSFRLLQLIP